MVTGVFDQAAAVELNAFIRDTIGRVRATLLRRGLRGVDLEDCCQQVFVTVIERWSRLRNYPDEGRYGYLHAVCRGAAVDWLRRARRQSDLLLGSETEYDAQTQLPSRSSTEGEYWGLRVHSAMEACLADCAPAVRTTFTLVCLLGHTEEEAAAIQRIPLGTVASRVRRVRSRLRARLSMK